MQFLCGRFELDLSTPRVMGIVNVTPDSFSDGGKFNTTDKAVAHAMELVEQGADILDIGGESTRPGATPVPLDEELNRVSPVVKALVKAGVPLSIDTYKPEVMREAIDAGVDSIVVDGAALPLADNIALVQSVVALLPKLDDVGRESIAAPVLGSRNLMSFVALSHFLDARHHAAVHF